MSTSSSEFGQQTPQGPIASLLNLARGLPWVLLAGVLVLGMGEAVLRGFDDFGLNGPGRIGRIALDDGSHLHHGGIWEPREFANRVVENELGYHAESFAPRADRGVRIAVLGDSYVRAAQLPIEAGFVARAQAQLPGVHLLALGRNGLYSPLQREMFVDELPVLFEGLADSAGIDGVVFCVRLWGGLNIANGAGDYPVTRPAKSWKWKVKVPVAAALRARIQPHIGSRSHVVSFVAHRAAEWLAADLRNQLSPINAQSVDFATGVLRDEVFRPIREEARRRGLAIGFLYLPSIAEHERSASPMEWRMRERTHEVLDGLGVPWIDAGNYFTGDGLFFPHDRHPNAAGHAQMAAALRDLVGEMDLDRAAP